MHEVPFRPTAPAPHHVALRSRLECVRERAALDARRQGARPRPRAAPAPHHRVQHARANELNTLVRDRPRIAV